MIAKSLQIQVSISSSLTATLAAWDVQSDGKILWKTKYFGENCNLGGLLGEPKLKMWPVSQRLARLVTKSYQGSLVGGVSRLGKASSWGTMRKSCQDHEELSQKPTRFTRESGLLLLTYVCYCSPQGPAFVRGLWRWVRHWVSAMLTSSVSLFIAFSCFRLLFLY